MEILAIAIIATTGFAGIVTTAFPSGRTRLTAMAIFLLGPCLVYAVLTSPFPAQLQWTRDPGYDATSWVPFAMTAAMFAFIAGVIGLAIGHAGRLVLRRKLTQT